MNVWVMPTIAVAEARNEAGADSEAAIDAVDAIPGMPE